MKRRVLLRAAVLIPALLGTAAQARETVLHEQSSRFGTLVVTEDEKGLRTLRFGRTGARQSVIKPGDPDHLELAYVRVALTGLATLSEAPRRVLVIGLGGGTLPTFMRRHYPEATIDAVDIDPGVVDVARRFFGFKEDARMRAYVEDGRRFIEKAWQRYDVVFLDAFSSSSVPEHLTTLEFLQALRRILTPGAVVIANVWSGHANRLYGAMIRTYQEAFDELIVLRVRDSGNAILLALPRKVSFSRDDLVAWARKLSAAKGFRFDLGDAAAYGYWHARVRQPGERMLRDTETVSVE